MQGCSEPRRASFPAIAEPVNDPSPLALHPPERPRRPRWIRGTVTALGLLTALVVAASALSAQAVLVQVTDDAGGQPLQGVLVEVRDGSGASTASILSDAAGRARFLSIPAGSYTVRAELIGYGSTSLPVEVRGGEPVVVQMRLASRAIELEGISVEGEERCEVRPDEGLRVSQVWDEARKALEAARLTTEGGVYQYRTRSYFRDMEDGRVVNQQSRRSTSYSRAPYESRPAEDLMDNGFVQGAGDDQGGDLYFAPDAAVLLSDEFLDTHCMRLRAGRNEDTGRIGLAFEPIRGRDVPDIEGTLWIEPSTWELVRLDYSYVNVHADVTLYDVGGQVEFQRLPNGNWIVPEWSIRMPWLARGRDLQGRPRVVQNGLRVEGGSVLSVREPGGDVILSTTTATVEGVILHEISSEPAPGTLVRLLGTDESMRTDEAGRFRFTDLVPGDYDVSFEHPAMLPYGVVGGPEPVYAARGEVTSVRMRVPSQISLVQRVCADDLDTRPEQTSALVGRVLERGTERPVEGAEVAVRWTNFRVDTPGDQTVVASRQQGAAYTTGPNGAFRACVVPQNTMITLEVRVGGVAMEPDTTRIPLGVPVLGRDLYVPPAGGTPPPDGF